MNTISENIEIILNEFFKLQESGKEAFLKCFMMMLKEVELEIILEAMDFRNNFSLSYENSALDNAVVSETGIEDLIGKVLLLGKDERIIFIRFLIIKSKAKEIDLILHILDSRRELINKKIEEDDNLTISSDIRDTIKDSKKIIYESLIDSKVFSKENKNRKVKEGFMDVNVAEEKNEAPDSTEVDTKMNEEHNNVDKKGKEVNQEYKAMKVIEEYKNVDSTENSDVKMKSEKPGRIYIAQNYEYLPCHLCFKNIKRIYMTTHTKNGNCAKSLVCDICGKVLSTYGNLKNHKGAHTNDYKLICDICSQGFHRKQGLDRHMSRIHLKIPNEEFFQCSLCPKTFNYKNNLVSHEKQVHGEPSYFCDLCPKGFQRRPNLEKHRRKHTGEKPFSCNKCGKSFSESGNMKQHMKRHTPTTLAF